MKQSLRGRLSISYAFIVIVCVLVISVLSNIFLESQFTFYVRQNQEQRNKDVVTLLGQQYYDDGKWNINVIQDIGIGALESGQIIRIVDANGKTLWDATNYNNGMCQNMLQHMAQNMYRRYPNWKGSYVENSYPVIKNGIKVGTAYVGYYGPFYFTDNDLVFINTLNKIFVGSGVLSLILAIILGILMARRISSPISRAVNTAVMISKGKYSERDTEVSNINEINQLTQTLNKLAETLERQELLRKRMTADVAHELRTPLATLQSHMEAMIDGIWEADSERLKSCHEEIIRINRLVGDLEKLAANEGENLIVKKSSFDVQQLINNIILNFQNEFKNKGISLKYEGQSLMVTADRDKLSQVVINLISNALKYTEAGGNVNVYSKSTGRGFEIKVKDTGRGISAEDLPYIFERFYRADKSRSRSTGGAGIGLTIVKSIVEAHLGSIEVKSEPDKGTEFTVFLPQEK